MCSCSCQCGEHNIQPIYGYTYLHIPRQRILGPGGSLGVKVGTHVKKWVSKLDPFKDVTFEKKNFSGPATNIIPLSHVFVEGGTLFRTTNAEIDPLMLNFNDFHIPKQDTRCPAPCPKQTPFHLIFRSHMSTHFKPE
jgi:hypothetical protein